MSTSFLERNQTLFWNVPSNFSMAHEKMKKSCNINGPVSLAELGRSYCGFQKMDVADNAWQKDQPAIIRQAILLCASCGLGHHRYQASD